MKRKVISMLKLKKKMIGLSIAAALLLTGCSSSNGNVSGTAASTAQDDQNITNIKEHSFFTDYPDLPFGEVVKKYVDSPKWTSSEDNGIVTVSVSGTAKGIDKQFTAVMTIQDDPEDPGNTSMIDLTKFQLGTVLCTTEETWDYLRDLYINCYNGVADLSQQYAAYEHAAAVSQIPEHDRLIAEEAGYEWVEPITVEDSHITGVLRNVSGGTKSMPAINFTLYDSTNCQIGTAMDVTSNLLDGDSWRFSAYIYDENTATYLLNSLN